MKSILNVLGRNRELFTDDVNKFSSQLYELVSNSKFLVLGGAGSIGKALTKELFIRNPLKLHVIDISENNLVELVRDIRSTYGYIKGDFKTYPLDIGSREYDLFWNSDGNYDYILNFSAMKHVRSEKDPYTLMRMIQTNIINVEKTLNQSIEKGIKNYFSVSSDKATNPVNMMGASKRIMEIFMLYYSSKISVTSARFANVAFSDGSLLHSFENRIKMQQPLVAPDDIKRYFITPKESAELCLFGCLLGSNRDIYFPKISSLNVQKKFSDIAVRYLKQKKLNPVFCDSEEEARDQIKNLNHNKFWPLLITKSDTTGEKSFEEFYSLNDYLDLKKYKSIGVIKNKKFDHENKINIFKSGIQSLSEMKIWQKEDFVLLFENLLENFHHQEKGKYLDSKM